MPNKSMCISLLLISTTLPGLTQLPVALGQQVLDFTLINAQSNTPISGFDPLVDGATLNLATLPTTALSVRANTDPPTVGSVVFNLSGAESLSQTENIAPYALFGDSGGNFNPWTPSVGSYTLTATAFSSGNAGGTSGPSLTIAFDVIDQPGPINEPPIVDAGADQQLASGASSAMLSGSADDLDGFIVSTTWQQLAGPAATFKSTDTLMTTVGGLVDGFYAFRLTALDDLGASSSDDVVVRVGVPSSSAVVTGDLKAWHRVTLTFSGPFASETGAPNPFLDYRMDVTFSNGVDAYVVPGFFAADGAAIATGATDGDQWRVNFSPPSAGRWDYVVSFRSGVDVAVDANPFAGSAGVLDGESGFFDVEPTDKQTPDFRADGWLQYADMHYLQFAGSGRYFVKCGADSPENWLGYTGFDNTFDGGAGPNTPDGLHAFPTHVADWIPGDPDWDRTDPPGSNDGRAIIGALNYLHSTGVNSIYFLPMNIGGDGRDSWPYVAPIIPSGSESNDNTRFDVSKLEQWDVVFAHAQSLGILLHFVLTEAEAPNKRELDDATLGVERRLFYRELVARFGYHNAVVWNLSEEYNLGLNLGAAEVISWAAAISEVDPYDTPVTVHNASAPGNAESGPWAPFIAQPDFDLTSLQGARRNTGWSTTVEQFRLGSAAAGRPIVVMIDEPGSPTRDFGSDFDAFRKSIIWPILLSGGGGEWFINDRDQSLEDFREFDQIWRDSGRVLRFVERYLPFWEMEPDDTLISGANGGFDGPQVFASEGVLYAAYLPAGGNASIDVGATAAWFEVLWFDPRNDRVDDLQLGSTPFVQGPGSVAIGSPPELASEDWAVLVRVVDGCPVDVNSDGVINISDLYDITQNPVDVDGDGLADFNDAACLAQYLRRGEREDIAAVR